MRLVVGVTNTLSSGKSQVDVFVDRDAAKHIAQHLLNAGSDSSGHFQCAQTGADLLLNALGCDDIKQADVLKIRFSDEETIEA